MDGGCCLVRCLWVTEALQVVKRPGPIVTVPLGVRVLGMERLQVDQQKMTQTVGSQCFFGP